jgi:cytochrome c oxidase cbb3-type subunit 3
MSTAWSWFVIIGTVGSILLFYAVLHLNRHTGRGPGETTGHNYDGIEEFDNPLPAWWYWLFVLTLVYGLGYMVWYPGLGNFAGVGNWTSVGELEIAQKESHAKYEPLFARYSQVPVEEIHKDPAAAKMGQRLFSSNCAVCHGSTAAGGFGFPDLIDDVWTWGDDGQAIKQTILEGRKAAMPAYGAIIGDQGVGDVTSYILDLNNREADSESVKLGKNIFETYCIACHGPGAKGMQALGAPDLTNGVWLYGNSRSRIEFSIKNGRNGEMPGFRYTLGENKAHVLAGYVYGLSR